MMAGSDVAARLLTHDGELRDMLVHVTAVVNGEEKIVQAVWLMEQLVKARAEARALAEEVGRVASEIRRGEGACVMSDYVIVAPCGHVRAWMAETGATKRDVAQFYREAAVKGYEIRRMDTDDARAKFGRCDVCEKAPPKEPGA